MIECPICKNQVDGIYTRTEIDPRPHRCGDCWLAYDRKALERLGFYKDKLDYIFETQKDLHKRVVFDNPRFPRDRNDRINVLCTALIHEGIELQRLTNWKWWKKATEFNIKEAQEELIDILHFWLDLASELDMTPQTIIEEYTKKNKINHQRIEMGY